MSDWVLDINAQLKNRRNAQSQEEQRRKKRSIYKLPPLILPPSISNDKKKAYQPQAVSFGPYHHEESHLEPMEYHKHRVFLNFLNRTRVSLDTIFNSMVEVAQDLKDSYDQLESKWEKDTEKFVKLMIVDGCFMLEILAEESWCDYSDDDPIFGPHGQLYVMPFIRRDMLLLENQLPMLVLFKLKDIKENDKEGMDNLNNQILKFCGSDADGSKMGKCLHILDVYHKGKGLVYMERDAIESTKHADGDDTKVVRSATELTEAGILFEKSKSKNLGDISFKNGVLSLPTFVIDDDTESIFLNLIAFERCHIGAGHAITSFICFMDNIIDHDSDISLLSSNGIIVNAVGTDKAAADLFNTMSKDLMMDRSSNLNMVHKSIVFFCKKPWPKWRATLTHTYFRSPWALISAVAAIILFVLTTVSTVYSVLGK